MHGLAVMLSVATWILLKNIDKIFKNKGICKNKIDPFFAN